MAYGRQEATPESEFASMRDESRTYDSLFAAKQEALPDVPGHCGTRGEDEHSLRSRKRVSAATKGGKPVAGAACRPAAGSGPEDAARPVNTARRIEAFYSGSAPKRQTLGVRQPGEAGDHDAETRNRVFSPGEFEERTDRYFEACLEEGRPVLFTGLILALGLNGKDEFYALEQQPEYEGAVKRARLRVEMSYEALLQKGGGSGVLFALKNFGWTDKQEAGEGTRTASWEDAVNEVTDSGRPGKAPGPFDLEDKDRG